MKVKIVKGRYWYSNKVGEILEVEKRKSPVIGREYYYYDNTRNDGSILIEDCEPVTDPVKIPFTFEAWDKDRGQKVWTRDGREVKQLTYFEDIKNSYSLNGVLDKTLRSWTKEGFYYIEKNDANEDIFLEHHERDYFVNIYRYSDGSFQAIVNNPEDVISNTNLIKTINFKA